MFANLATAYVLWFLFGIFGAHRFYVGRSTSGLVWLCTGGLLGIGWIIDFFLLPSFVNEHNKQEFQNQMMNGDSLLYDNDYSYSNVQSNFQSNVGMAYSTTSNGYGAPYANANFYVPQQPPGARSGYSTSGYGYGYENKGYY
jgi:TM2 domain-containing membrane protein YozV